MRRHRADSASRGQRQHNRAYHPHLPRHRFVLMLRSWPRSLGHEEARGPTANARCSANST
eukprot:scaffold105602_cov30-Tisochrysis_lutea.AAC.1